MIRVQNVYYMLAYAFQVLHEQGYKNVATEEFDNVAELLSAILCRGVSVQIKRGLIRQYISREEALASPRGKLEIGESIKTQVIRKKQLICNYDEFSVDAYPNRIIKTTMDLLLRGSISKARKKEIRKLMIFFDGISILDIHSINWDIQYDRNNQTYRMLIAVCRFVIKGLLQTTADGSTKIMDYAAEAVHGLRRQLGTVCALRADIFMLDLIELAMHKAVDAVSGGMGKALDRAGLFRWFLLCQLLPGGVQLLAPALHPQLGRRRLLLPAFSAELGLRDILSRSVVTRLFAHGQDPPGG